MTNSLRSLVLSLVTTAALCLSPLAHSAPSDCPSVYFGGERPNLVNQKLGVSARELCSDHYAVWYSGVARSPLYAAEYLTGGALKQARAVRRADDFRPDTRLPRDWRANLDDFRGSGFDRGHLAPAANFPTPASNSQSFLLSNMIAQDPKLNRGLWAGVEGAVRAYANRFPVYVVTGALFVGPQIDKINGRVLVPTHVYKLVYDPRLNAAGAYVVENAPNKRHRELSLLDLERLAGIDFLPHASNVSMLKLPRPRY